MRGNLPTFELYREVKKWQCLKNLGVEKGDTVSMYLTMCPELWSPAGL
jgi:acetyl-CoA synthetase